MTSVDVVNIINDVLSDLCGPEKTAEAEEVDPSGEHGDSIEDPLCSLQLSLTQSQSVDGTEPVTQEEDVPIQLLLEDQRKKKKLAAFERKKAARLEKAAPRKSTRLVGKVASPSLGELPGSAGEDVVVTPCRSPHVLAFVKPSPMIGSGLSAKVKRCGVKCKGGLTKFLFAARAVRRKRGPKPSEGATEEEVDVKRFNKTIHYSLKEVKVCASYLQPRHKVRVVKSGFGCVFDFNIDSKISHPLMGHLYTKIDPSTMILDMGEYNKKLCITSDSMHHLFGFPQGDSTPPMPSKDGFDDVVMRLKAKLGYKRSADIKTKELRNILKDLVKDEKNHDLALQATRGSYDASVSLGKLDGLLKTASGEIARVPMTVERLSRADRILPPDNGFDPESSKDALSIEAEIVAEIRQNVVHLRTILGMFKSCHDARCKPFEHEARVVMSQIERPRDIDKGHGRGNEDRSREAIDEDVREDNFSLKMQFDGVSVDSEKVANKHASDIGCSEVFDQNEHKFPTGDWVFYGEQNKSTRGDSIINTPNPEEASTEGAAEPGSTQAVPLNPLAIQRSVVARVCSSSRATTTEPTVVLILELTYATGTTEDDNTICTGGCDDSETKTDISGKEEDLSRSNADLGKNP
ncbi:hypothetical protein ZWY2020_058787 [Hordeum vulgare]|nr:hypothetical protein ZWY2020_058787 [Hordeum vulgare]